MDERDRPKRNDDNARRTVSLAGLAVAILLAALAYYLIEALADESQLEDCLLQGRSNCQPVSQSPSND